MKRIQFLAVLAASSALIVAPVLASSTAPDTAVAPADKKPEEGKGKHHGGKHHGGKGKDGHGEDKGDHQGGKGKHHDGKGHKDDKAPATAAPTAPAAS